MPSPTNHLTGCFHFFCFWLLHFPFIVFVILFEVDSHSCPHFAPHDNVFGLLPPQFFMNHLHTLTATLFLASACASFDSALYACLNLPHPCLPVVCSCFFFAPFSPICCSGTTSITASKAHVCWGSSIESPPITMAIVDACNFA